VHVLQQYVHFADGRVEHEDEVDLEAFFDEMRAPENLPTTSHPTVDDFTATYEQLLDRGDQVVSIHSSSALSHTCDAAREACEQLGAADRIRVLNSQYICGGLALIVLAAARRAAAGEAIARVVEAAEEARNELKLWFVIDTLEFLRRSGRIGAAGAWIGSTLRVKPILTIEDGQMTPVERVRTGERAFERIVDYARQRHASGADAWVVQHVRSSDEAGRLVDSCREVFQTDPVFVSEIGAVVGAHTGPGLIGLSALPPRLLT
jgi:DegV family protein with EDD domain